MAMIRCILKPGKEKPALGRHPWVFSGAIDEIDEGFAKGDLVQVLSSDHTFLGIGYLNPESQITVRILSFEETEINRNFFLRRIRSALQLRQEAGVLNKITNACRLIHAEGDFLPGLIVDQYGDYLAAQFLTAGMDRWKEEITEALMEVVKPKAVYENGDSEFREREGLRRDSLLLAGSHEIPEEIEILENGNKFLVHLYGGQKTGFFLDQRENRRLAGSLVSGKTVLNAFSYTGAFSVYAARGGASSVVSVDTSAPALALAEKHMALNAPNTPHTAVRRDVFQHLRETSSTFDFIILDPPAFCKSKAQMDPACRGYKDINLLAFRMVKPGGFLFTASCSSHITPDLFQKVVFSAAKDSGRDVRVIQRTGHAADHPVSIGHPEGEYLKGLLCQVL